MPFGILQRLKIVKTFVHIKNITYLCIVEKNKKCSDKIWSVFYDRFGLNYNEVQQFIKSQVETALKLGAVKLAYEKQVRIILNNNI